MFVRAGFVMIAWTRCECGRGWKVDVIYRIRGGEDRSAAQNRISFLLNQGLVLSVGDLLYPSDAQRGVETCSMSLLVEFFL